jgi:hypothetical protein
MRKQGAIDISIGTLLSLAVVGIVIIVMFAGVFPVFEKKAEASIEKGKCEITVLLSAVALKGSIGLVEVPPACKMRRIDVTMDMVNSLSEFSAKRISVFQQLPAKYKDALSYFPDQSPNTLNEFAIDKIFADELDNCWDKVLQGKLTIFGDKAFRGHMNCIICSKIKFDNTVLNVYKGKKVNSLTTWLQYNPIPSTNVAYWEYLSEGQTGVTGLMHPDYFFEISDTPYAVVYTNFQESATSKLIDKIANFPLWKNIFGTNTPAEINMLRLVPYSQQSIRGDLGCDPETEVS